jgi:hypothetical protein
MRKLSGAAVATIMAIAFYFTLFWGSEALRMLTSPSWGLDDAWRSQFVFVIGGMLGLAPVGLIKLAAFFAMLKLAVAAICAIHVLDRLRSLVAGKADVDVLEAGLILIVAISILAVGPAVWSQNVELARDYTLQLVLAGIAIALCLVERSYGSPRNAKPAIVTELAATPRRAPWYAPFR